jgi:Mor family transcriptional regulator
MTKPSPTPKLTALAQSDPDLVDRIFDYILSELPEIAASVQKHKAAVRAEFRGEECYIASRPATERQHTVSQVLALFDGRNATEVARKLQISRATVYRLLKQPGRPGVRGRP